MKYGLVLEGGAMRGIYTAGVLDVLSEEGITFDGVVGVSAGAIHGCSFVSGQAGRSIRYYMKYSRDKHFMSVYSLLTTGSLVGEEFAYHDIPERLDPFDWESFSANPTRFYVTCTNLETGRPEYIRIRDMYKDMDYMRASASMPFVSPIVERGGRKLLDGGVSDSVPLRAFERHGYERNLVVLTRPAGYRKKPRKSSMASVFYRQYPEFVRTWNRRPQRYNRTMIYVEDREAAGAAFVLRPSQDLGISRMENDPEKLYAQYELGRIDCMMRLEELKKFLGR